MPRENSFSDDGRSLTPDLELPEVPEHPQPKPTKSTTPTTPPLKSPTHATTGAHLAPGAASAKFRAVARRVIKLHRTTSMMVGVQGVGAEPGVDPRRDGAYLTYGHIRANCEIEVVDYSTIGNNTRRMSNNDFITMMTSGAEREPWVKVRWINIGGISWDVMSALAIKYRMHPLALEDVLQSRGNARSKADYYKRHLHLRALCHTVISDEEKAAEYAKYAEAPILPTLARSSSPAPMSENEEKAMSGTDEDKTAYDGSAPVSRFSTSKMGSMRRRTGKGDIESQATTDYSPPRNMTKMTMGPTARLQWEEEKTIGALKQGERVNVRITPMHIFLLRDGTVISIHPDPDLNFTTPISNRLRQRDTGLRATCDPSLLVYSLLDVVVDSALQVVDSYQEKILKLEKAILLRPKMYTVRHLHIMSGDLILHKRTLEPLRTLVYGLRRYDLDRCAAIMDTAPTDPLTGMPMKVKVEGYMTHKAITYLADVHDHMEHILTSLDMFSAIAENLINFTFNMISNDMNEVMRRLTLATIIFLPLTLLTGYFGMNFDNMWSIHHNHSDEYFWFIAIPLMSLVVPVFLYGDLMKIIHYMKKKVLVKMIAQASKIQ